LRGGADFEYENMIYHANKIINPSLETIFFITENELVGVSSSVVRQIYTHGGDVSKLIPFCVSLN
jgi:pantetheine-phosphate adenylyltransferase